MTVRCGHCIMTPRNFQSHSVQWINTKICTVLFLSVIRISQKTVMVIADTMDLVINQTYSDECNLTQLDSVTYVGPSETHELLGTYLQWHFLKIFLLTTASIRMVEHFYVRYSISACVTSLDLLCNMLVEVGNRYQVFLTQSQVSLVSSLPSGHSLSSRHFVSIYWKIFRDVAGDYN